MAGSHREVGQQIGAHCGDAIARRCAALSPAAAEAALPYREVTEREYMKTMAEAREKGLGTCPVCEPWEPA